MAHLRSQEWSRYGVGGSSIAVLFAPLMVATGRSLLRGGIRYRTGFFYRLSLEDYYRGSLFASLIVELIVIHSVDPTLPRPKGWCAVRTLQLFNRLLFTPLIVPHNSTYRVLPDAGGMVQDFYRAPYPVA